MRRRMKARTMISPNVGLAANGRRKSLSFYPDNQAIKAGAAAEQDLAVVEQVEFAGELPLGMHGEDVRLAVLVQVEDFDAAIHHEKEVNAALATLEDESAAR